MAKFTLQEVCEATGAYVNSDEEILFSGVCTDTRKIKQGDLYVALQGENFDGHQFAAEAAQKGAAGIIAAKEITLDIPVFKVRDTLAALQALAKFHRLRFSIPVIAITGSNGKTTTKDMVAAALASSYHVLKTQGNFNNEIGLPLTLLQLTQEHQAAVVEMGMRGLGQIRELMRIACPTHGIVTNVGETHMELLGSLEAIAAAKGELVEDLPETATVFLNYDNEYVRQMDVLAKGKVVFYGCDPASDVQALGNTYQNGRTRIDLRTREGNWQLEIPVVGRHNVYNAMAAVAVAEALGVAKEKIAAGLSSLELSAMRLHVERRGAFCIINDAYNASPMSMLAALDALKEVSIGRRVAVLGDMLELGEVAAEAHARVGQYAVQSGVEVLIALGPWAKHLAHAAKCDARSVVVYWTESPSEAKAFLRQTLQAGDTVLLKGSRGMRMEQMMEVFEPCSK
ncbi:UDP-N-acetylmuramoyl-tripeptide--D-alanyl-D-alanine ligase [Azotosporobacter soli]|uniref:UDP-N-acetylmuramoyl-tripeptide--D-alanyl-D- alanine ligase n=1 Tax=Azotosporobacter soli TaxID=3055040 RepID=UPI0031FEEA04